MCFGCCEGGCPKWCKIAAFFTVTGLLLVLMFASGLVVIEHFSNDAYVNTIDALNRMDESVIVALLGTFVCATCLCGICCSVCRKKWKRQNRAIATLNIVNTPEQHISDTIPAHHNTVQEPSWQGDTNHISGDLVNDSVDAILDIINDPLTPNNESVSNSDSDDSLDTYRPQRSNTGGSGQTSVITPTLDASVVDNERCSDSEEPPPPYDRLPRAPGHTGAPPSYGSLFPESDTSSISHPEDSGTLFDHDRV